MDEGEKDVAMPQHASANTAGPVDPASSLTYQYCLNLRHTLIMPSPRLPAISHVSQIVFTLFPIH
jgi:hypothetical protein